jgi:flagellin
MVINTNVTATRSARLLASSSAQLSKSLTRLSSGSKLNSPEDDAAGLGQSLKFDAQIHRNSATVKNLSNAVSFTQTQDGFLQKVQRSLDRMSEISVLAQDVTKTDTDRSNYQAEFTRLQDFIFDSGQMQFNGVSLFAYASVAGFLEDRDTGLAVNTDGNGATVALTAVSYYANTFSSGLTGIWQKTRQADGIGIEVSSSVSAAYALSRIKSSVQGLANLRAAVGANIQRLILTQEQLSLLNENLSASTSRIKDVDVATESTSFARYNLLVQSGTAMLAQANLMPSSTLRLLG